VPFLQPPTWSDADLKASRDRAEALFTERRREEGPRAFEAMYLSLRPTVADLFERSDDLRSLNASIFESNPDAWQVSRYVTGPPISQEDLWTLVGGPKFKRVPAEFAEATADAIRVVIDPIRFPWIAQHRSATNEERERAIMATALLWAAQQVGTVRRGEASMRQELQTASALSDAGIDFDPARSKVQFIDELARGTYSRERVIAGSKCDVPARLRDGRLFTIECKVSNGPKNGWKRLNREVGGKAVTWRSAFGSNLVAAVVLAGVFDLSALKGARDQGVTIFWDHELEPLTDFARRALPS